MATEIGSAYISVMPSLAGLGRRSGTAPTRPRLWRDVLPEGRAPADHGCTPITLDRVNRWLGRHGYAGRFLPEGDTLPIALFFGDTHGEPPTLMARVTLIAGRFGVREIVVNSDASDIEFETVIIPFDIGEDD